MTAVGIATSIGSLIGGAKNKPSYQPLIDPTSGWTGREIDPVLAKLLAAADRSSSVQWGNTSDQLADQYQRRGLGGSGIEFENISEAARQQQLDYDAMKQSYALQLYTAWMARKQQEREWAIAQNAVANQQEAANSAQSGQFWNSLGQLGGKMGNHGGGLSSGGGSNTSGGGSNTGSMYRTTSAIPTLNSSYYNTVPKIRPLTYGSNRNNLPQLTY